MLQELQDIQNIYKEKDPEKQTTKKSCFQRPLSQFLMIHFKKPIMLCVIEAHICLFIINYNASYY